MLTPSFRQHFAAQDANPFSGLVQSQLGRAKQHQADAWSSFSDLVGNTPSFGDALREENQTQAPTWTSEQAPSRPGSGPMADDLARYGFADNVPRSLINTESGGNFDAENGIQGSGGKGHFGILQFGHGRLTDAKRAGIIPEDMTPQQFKASRDAQVAVSNWHFKDIDSRIQAKGYDRLVGQSIGDTPITMNGMRAMAHLGGFGGLSRFIGSGGQYNPSDAFGTSLAKYGRTHSNS